jgi:hypothetical protein
MTLAITALCGLLLAMTPARSDARAPDHGPFGRILAASVRAERVDYLHIRERHWSALAAYLDTLAAIEPLDLPRKDRLAFYINLYNATTIREVILRLRAGYSAGEREHAIFDEPLVRMNGRKLSLNQLEHQHVRAEYADPRIHAALVCAAVSCPPLAPVHYEGVELDRLLDTQMRAFVMDPKRNQVDLSAKTLRLSSIFNWYQQDFAAKGGVLAYFDAYHPGNFTAWTVAFLDYDWSLNIAPPPGDWIAVTADTPLRPAPGATGGDTAKQDALFEVLERTEGAVRVRRPFGAGEAWIAADRVTPFVAP